MKQTDRSMFWACLVLSVAALGWAHAWYSVTSALYSDLAHYGIVYGSEPFNEIVAITQRHIIGIVSPVAAVLVICLSAWAWLLFLTPTKHDRDG